MLFIPAIDISRNRSVRLLRGEFFHMTQYEVDPVLQARLYEKAGVERIHIVDLDAARGIGNNRAIIRKIRRSVSCVLQVGGGIRNEEDVEHMLEMDINYLIVGTTLVRAPELVAGWISHYGRCFLAGIDVAAGMVHVEGWQQSSTKEGMQFVKDIRKMGMSGIVFTVIEKDGTLEGPDIEITNSAATHAGGMPIFLSGGISSLEDLSRVATQGHAAIQGVVVGKALYEKKFTVEEALSLCKNA